ncbi:MAG: hypothetical protein CK424_03520 [Legionella sp.]|nr:MAG: hypothetical protein CK424_03520 [Legionella sp.]
MGLQPAITDDASTQIPLFDFEDIHYILKHSLGLRLTSKASNTHEGGTGDAVPLTHLAGGKDIVEFVTLSAYALKNNTYSEVQNQLETIYDRYSDPQSSSDDCVPVLIQTYAQLLNIKNANDFPKPSVDSRLPTIEEDVLIKIYKQTGGPLLLIYIFDKSKDYYRDLPVFRLLLTTNFNHMLQKRLKYNNNQWFMNEPDMYYVLLSNERFASAYGLKEYPMGKVGKHTFSAEEVCSSIQFSTKEYQPSAVISWLKNNLRHVQDPADKPRDVGSHNSYFQKGIAFCSENKHNIMAVVGLGLFAVASSLATTSLQQEDESYTP